jgi:hypothetical protein
MENTNRCEDIVHLKKVVLASSGLAVENRRREETTAGRA